MKYNGKHYRTLWPIENGDAIEVIDQRKLPHQFVTCRLSTLSEAAEAIRNMTVRGAPLIGATAAYGFAFGLRNDPSDKSLLIGMETLLATRPTAVNLRWALESMHRVVTPLAPEKRAAAAFTQAAILCDEDVETNRRIGSHGLALFHQLLKEKKGDCLNILTHCNAGWLACIDWGTALSPIYQAHDAGLPVHVLVDETRPRNQGAFLTAWELQNHGVPCTLIPDNTGGHLMQHGMVDLCIVGTDRTTASGDVCNKIGTYLKALAAYDNDVPFYVALPGSTIDWSINDGLKEIPIEQRNAREVTHLSGKTKQGKIEEIALVPEGIAAANYAFDVTPARLVTGLITERGICPASAEGLQKLFPEFAHELATR